MKMDFLNPDIQSLLKGHNSFLHFFKHGPGFFLIIFSVAFALEGEHVPEI